MGGNNGRATPELPTFGSTRRACVKCGMREPDRGVHIQSSQKNPTGAGDIESETFMGSALDQAARRAVRHFSAADATAEPEADAAEIWGRRIGRLLSLLAGIGLVVYLVLTYLR
jgi:hypothetical protein